MENASHVSQWNGPYERRQKARIQDSIPARLCGVDEHGRSFDVEAALDNLSAGGLYARLGCRTNCGASLLASFRILAGPGIGQTGTHWAAQGIVRRVELQADGTCGVGVEFTSYHEVWKPVVRFEKRRSAPRS